MLETERGDGEMGRPLVLCRSRGGPYDNDAFLSGWRLGDIDDFELTTPGQD